MAAAGAGLKPASQPYAATIRYTQNSLTVAPRLWICASEYSFTCCTLYTDGACACLKMRQSQESLCVFSVKVEIGRSARQRADDDNIAPLLASYLFSAKTLQRPRSL